MPPSGLRASLHATREVTIIGATVFARHSDFVFADGVDAASITISSLPLVDLIFPFNGRCPRPAPRRARLCNQRLNVDMESSAVISPSVVGGRCRRLRASRRATAGDAPRRDHP